MRLVPIRQIVARVVSMPAVQRAGGDVLADQVLWLVAQQFGQYYWERLHYEVQGEHATICAKLWYMFPESTRIWSWHIDADDWEEWDDLEVACKVVDCEICGLVKAGAAWANPLGQNALLACHHCCKRVNARTTKYGGDIDLAVTDLICAMAQEAAQEARKAQRAARVS